MCIKVFRFILILLLSSYNLISGQISSKWSITNINFGEVKEIDYSQNQIINAQALNTFFEKLNRIKKEEGGSKAVIVHIGDSHIQADMLTHVVRTAFQDFFGNAGRGLVFPYQVAKTNAPNDIKSTSTTPWKSNRVAKTELLPACGISGFGLQSVSINPDFNLELRSIDNTNESFDQLQFFMKGNFNSYSLEYSDKKDSLNWVDSQKDKVDLKTSTTGFKIHFKTNDSLQFYGVSLEKKASSGILYHTIGVNGAKYSDFNKSPEFWNQLSDLNADCFILSLGTNEAQDPKLVASDFIFQVKLTVDSIKKISPNASILITTPPVSYFKKRKPNLSLVVISNALATYCKENNLACWNLFSISKGLRGAKKWKKSQKLRQDLVHFSKEGYVLQGSLLADAFSKAWNHFTKN